MFSVGGFVPLSQAFLARRAARDVGFSRADATAMRARRLPRRMLYEHRCCDFDNLFAKWELVVKGYQRSFSHSEGTLG